MCLIVTDKWNESRVTDKDVVCYKVGMKENGCIVAPFYEDEYCFGKNVRCQRFEYDIPYDGSYTHPYTVEYGYHSYVEKKDAFRLREILEQHQLDRMLCFKNEYKYVVLRCVIPSDTAYYEGNVETGFYAEIGTDGELPKGYVSERIRIEEIIDG